MELNEVRRRYIEFFKSKGHKEIPSASLVPEGDSTTLFTGSGMQPLVPYLLGKEHPSGARLVNSQKCFRAEDIEEVGDNRHTTFFEMLGNWSFGSYWKEEQLSWFFEFLTNKEVGVGLDPQKIYVTVFSGDEKAGVSKDTESIDIWKKLFQSKGVDAKDVELITEEHGGELGMQNGRIFAYREKNWWSRAGKPENMPAGEPGGPDSEVFYDFGTPHDTKFGKECHPNCDCGRFLEIGNSVFMEYRKTENGFEKLPRRNVDFGGGLERITAASKDNPDVLTGSIFESDTLSPIRAVTSVLSHNLKNLRIIADHFRSAIFLIIDGVLPSNVDRGYFLRRLIRRAISSTQNKKISSEEISAIVEMCAFTYRDVYSDIGNRKKEITDVVLQEAQQFEKTLQQGLQKFEKIAINNISGKDAFLLFTSYGFPIDMTIDLAEKHGVSVDKEGFLKEFEKHRELSRAGAEKKFKGGLADTSEMSLKYHTATHLLHQALRDVLGTHVSQKGSNITPERLRFDFAHPTKMTPDEIARVEKIVNEKITADLPVQTITLPLEEAKKSGALHFFDEKYPDIVLIHYIGDSLETAYSKEFCGGPHVTHTSVIGHFKIIKEEAVSAGVRRIKAVVDQKNT